jgi:biofilm PGA synthesis N-glycosyltransferase PgaC
MTISHRDLLVLSLPYLGVFIFYFALMLWLIYGWIRLPFQTLPSALPDLFVTVIIPVRNEEKNIRTCLESILSQHYPAECMRVIVVDDASDDRTGGIVMDIFAEHPKIDTLYLRYEDDKERVAHKKYMLTQAMAETKDGLVVTTDGDCTVGKDWLRSMAHCYLENKCQLIIGPVAFQKEQNFFGRMQSLEFAGLLAVAGGSAGCGAPLLCNGANLAYPKKVFEEINGYEGDTKASGDDMFLLQKIQKCYPDGIRFLKSKEALVFTQPQERVRAFFSQRKRWASKFGAYKGLWIKGAALTVFLCNLLLVLGVLLVCLIPSFRGVYLILAGGKLIIDFLFLFLAISFTQRRSLLWIYLPEQLVYSIYVVLSACLSFRKDFEWKGRRIDK